MTVTNGLLKTVQTGPRWLTPVSLADVARGEGAIVCDFIEQSCRVTERSFAAPAGELLRLRPWQRDALGRIFARGPTGRRLHRRALFGVPRKNGKSGMVAGIALYGLTMEDAGAQVYSVAGDRAQSKLVFGVAKKMVELDPDLNEECHVYRDAIEHVSTGSVYRAMSSASMLKEGLGPSLVVVDEVHVISEELWNVYALAGGARIDPLMIGITTAGARYDTHGHDTICYGLWDYGCRVASGEIIDPTFYLEWWAADEALDYKDEATWALANPGLGDILDIEQLRADVGPTTESEFRTKHLNQWVTKMTAAFPSGAWEACAKPEREVQPDEPVVLGIDGSWTGDSTALMGCTVKDQHVFTIAAWERPPNDMHWRVEASAVDAAMLDAWKRYTVWEIAADPHEWRAQIQAWQEQKLPVVEWPTSSLVRMVPAFREFYAAVLERRLSHDGNPALARHVGNAVLKVDRYGARPTKEYGSSERKIDMFIAALIARDRAAYFLSNPPRTRHVYSF